MMHQPVPAGSSPRHETVNHNIFNYPNTSAVNIRLGIDSVSPQFRDYTSLKMRYLIISSAASASPCFWIVCR